MKTKHLTALEKKGDELIKKNIDQYRSASTNRKALGPDAESLECSRNAWRAYTMQMDRAAGALDALHELFPNSTVWAETKWIH